MATGERVGDRETMERISGLVIPPAWNEVWICPWPHGHIQAVGTDDAGRRQYLYHPAWRSRRDAEKFRRSVEFGMVLPEVRAAVEADLGRTALDDRRVVATAVRLLDIGCFRIGSEEYARDHETFGIATLRKDHAVVKHDEVVFCYPAKGSITRTLSVDDSAVRRVIGQLRRRRSGGPQLFAWKVREGWTDLRSVDINTYLKEVAGPEFSAKDFRTWSGTVFAAAVLAGIQQPLRSATARRRAVTAAVRDVAEHLGNTAAVCRASYIDPRVIDHFEAGRTIADFGWSGSARSSEQLRNATESAVIAMLAEPEAAETAA